MIEWAEEGVVLSVRRLGEGNAVIETLTAGHGRHAGIVRGGAGRKLGPVIQPGAQLALAWKARLEDHLGAFTVEPVRSRASALADPLALAGLASITALLVHVLPEREAQPRLYAQSVDLLDRLTGDADWPLAYLHWEIGLLEQMGFGLDLATCAATGGTDDLVYVSPRTGRAVSRAGAGDWAPKLLPLPPCLVGGTGATATELMQGLSVSGHFLATRLAPALGERDLPPARARLVARLERAFTPRGEAIRRADDAR